MIAQHGDRTVAQRPHQPQHLQRTGATIDQVANEPEPVLCGVEVDLLQQELQLVVTTLNVAYGIGGHDLE